jgi:hypothetical protein
MNLSEIRLQVRNLLNEDVPGFWSDAKLNSYINLAELRTNSIVSSVRQDYFTVSATFNCVAGTKSYNFPTGCKFIRRLEIYDPLDHNNIVKIDELKFPRLEANGDWLFTQDAQPKRYVVRGTQFDLYPVPDAVYSFRIYYDLGQANLTLDTDIPATPVEFHDMIVFWACVLAKKQNEEDDAGFVNLFNVRKAELIQVLINRGGEDSTTVEAYLQGII